MASPSHSTELTRLLREARNGTDEAKNRLLERVHQQLKRIAVHYMKYERPGSTLQPTALVNEAYLRMFGSGDVLSWEDRAHFFGIAARQMRNILVDHARRKKAIRHGGGGIQITLSHAEDAGRQPQDFDALNEALSELEKREPQVAQIIELKFFGGLEDREVAQYLGINFAAVRRNWQFGKAFLFDRLR